MKNVKSFFGRSASRDELLADVKADGLLSTLWLRTRSNGLVVELLASEYNLDRALLKFLSVLAGSQSNEASRTVLAGALEAISLDESSDGIVARWLLGVCAPAIAARLVGTAGVEALDTIVALVRRSREEVIDDSEWQSARRGMIFVEGLTPLQAAYAEVAMAMAWDPGRYPIAIEDVLVGWEDCIRKEIFLSEDWTDEIAADFDERLVQAHRQVAIAIREKRAAGEQLTGDYLPRMLQDHFDANGELELFLRSDSLDRKAQAAAEEWHAQRQSEYLLFAGTERVDISSGLH